MMATIPIIVNPACLAPMLLLIPAYIVTSLFGSIFGLIKWRLRMLRLRSQGLPMPPYNIFLGHLPVVQKIISSIPPDAHGHYLPDQIRRAYPDLGPNFYLDLAPFAPSMLVVTSPDTLHQVTQSHPLEKFPNMTTFLKPLTGGLDIVTMRGSTWKRWRGIFNPGFSAGNLVALTPSIVQKTEIFCSILSEHSKKRDVVRMKDLTDNLTMDIIGLVVLDQDFDCQRTPNSLVSGLRKQIRWLSFGAEPNLFTRYNPLRPLVHWYYGPKIDAILMPELEKRFEAHKRNEKTGTGTRSVMNLALKTYESEVKVPQNSTTDKKSGEEMDPLFKKICLAQIKLFLFSGHDTTSSSICYTLYLLSQHPSVLKLVQQELDEVFSPDREEIPRLISENPHLLNSIPYTTAVIKESLRLFPTVSSTREGERDFSVTDTQGRKFPTEAFLVWVNPHAVHHSPLLWDHPDEFIPERHLGDKRGEIPKGAWRPFENGARNCIGQELAMMESKIVIAMVARSFVVRDVYEELRGGRMVEGEKAYQVQLSQPVGDLPCRIERI